MPSIRRNFIIQRLDSFVSDGGASYDSKIFTIEHVLPQNPAADSKWMQDWSETKHKLWLNRIANLVPLTRQRNSAAQNYDFDTKKTKYFLSKSGTSSYSLTTQVISVWSTTHFFQKLTNMNALIIKLLRTSIFHFRIPQLQA